MIFGTKKNLDNFLKQVKYLFKQELPLVIFSDSIVHCGKICFNVTNVIMKDFKHYFKSFWTMDRNLIGTTTSSQSGPGSRWLYTPYSYKTVTITHDIVKCYKRKFLERGLAPLQGT